MFLHGGYRQIHVSGDARIGLVVDTPSQQHGAAQRGDTLKRCGQEGETLAVRGYDVRQRRLTGMDFRDLRTISGFTPKPVRRSRT